ncbi:hypothetical protein [Calidifontibacillus erzurumensis]|uniref:Uncharacterized protein n=1 Tax=Calidifontibacillus erzurumensis TaxID=2741433 RepID=A0A8J8KCQ7_9BACI|nr:hypothetical protein [Calidifontibacillus erzurumensis]NSL52223.1 hypothetical protein [Calidifontibacillus erzurumensis]
MKGWIISNTAFILLVIIWSFWHRDYVSPIIVFSQSFAVIAVVLFLININMYFVFLIIRKSKVKEVKKTLALFSRKMMKFHVAIAITATALIIVHAILMISFHPIELFAIKKASGLLAMVILAVHLFSGWLRRKKASGFRRLFHLRMAFIFLFFFLVHIFV